MSAEGQTGAAAWTNGERVITADEVIEGCHFIFDTDIEGYWVTNTGGVREEVREEFSST